MQCLFMLHCLLFLKKCLCSTHTRQTNAHCNSKNGKNSAMKTFTSGVILYYLIAHFPEFRVLCTTTQSCLKICLEFLKYSLMSDEYKKVFFLGVATRLGPGDSV